MPGHHNTANTAAGQITFWRPTIAQHALNDKTNSCFIPSPNRDPSPVFFQNCFFIPVCLEWNLFDCYDAQVLEGSKWSAHRVNDSEINLISKYVQVKCTNNDCYELLIVSPSPHPTLMTAVPCDTDTNCQLCKPDQPRGNFNPDQKQTWISKAKFFFLLLWHHFWHNYNLVFRHARSSAKQVVLSAKLPKLFKMGTFFFLKDIFLIKGHFSLL